MVKIGMIKIFMLLLFPALQSCSGDTPSANDANKSPIVDHSKLTDCQRCHEPDRPKTATHPAQGDCFLCHKYPSWAPITSLK